MQVKTQSCVVAGKKTVAVTEQTIDWNNNGTLITGTLIPSSTITFVEATKGYKRTSQGGNFAVNFSYPTNFTSNNYIGIICLGSSTINNPTETIGVVLFNKGNYTVLTGTNLSSVTVTISINNYIELSAYNIYYPQYFGILLQY